MILRTTRQSKRHLIPFISMVVTASLALAGCGSPTVIVAGNMHDTTSIPIRAAIPTNEAMPGMDMGPSPQAVAQAASPAGNNQAQPGPTKTELVIAWVLYGTPTQTPTSPGMANPPDVAVSPTRNVTVVPTPSVTLSMQPTSQLVTKVAQAVTSMPAAGDPAKGKAVFTGLGGCSACHDVANGIVIVGPSLKGIAARAGTRKPGVSAADYLHESIVAPNAYVVQGFTAGVMTQSLAQTLSAQQINDVVAYLLTLK